MIRKTKIKVPIYGSNVNIIYNTEDTVSPILEIYPELERFFEPVESAFSHALLLYRGNKVKTKQHYIIISDNSLIQSTPGVIAHECFHITSFILGDKGLHLNEGSEEAYTYLLGYLVDEVTKYIEKWRQ